MKASKLFEFLNNIKDFHDNALVYITQMLNVLKGYQEFAISAAASKVQVVRQIGLDVDKFVSEKLQPPTSSEITRPLPHVSRTAVQADAFY